MPTWVDEAFAEYQKRMPREAKIRLLEIKPDKRDGGKTAPQVMSAEAERIEAALPKDCVRIALDEHGKSMTRCRRRSALPIRPCVPVTCRKGW